MSNPFEDPEGPYYVLVNEEEQHSLWPSFATIPAGWHIVPKRIYQRGLGRVVQPSF